MVTIGGKHAGVWLIYRFDATPPEDDDERTGEHDADP
jgi:hypothetical protein